MVAALRCVWPQIQWYQLAYATEIKSIQLHDSIEGLSQKIVSCYITLHYITLHMRWVLYISVCGVHSCICGGYCTLAYVVCTYAYAMGTRTLHMHWVLVYMRLMRWALKHYICSGHSCMCSGHFNTCAYKVGISPGVFYTTYCAYIAYALGTRVYAPYAVGTRALHMQWALVHV